MGLTGIIGEVTLKLISISTPYMKVQHHSAANLDELFQLLQSPASDDRYTVAWIDSMAKGRHLGRGVAMCGHHAAPDEVSKETVLQRKGHVNRARNIPFDFPGFALNSLSIAAFNELYFRLEGGKQQPFISNHESFFYPLDAIQNWNRLYGKRGFVQYQCVIPDDQARSGILKLLEALALSGRPSFLAVLKRLGVQGKGLLSFSTAGYTLALDLPIKDQGLFALLDHLDDIVLQHGGRVYLAKDARLSAESFRAMYPNYDEWLKIKNAFDPHNIFSSSLARRLEIGTK
jgi:FAD/FMN-containing dehydrogenase